MKFRESYLANKYCKGVGIEIGPAAHNPFNLDGCLFVAPKEDREFYNQSQINMGEQPLIIDIEGTADCIPLDDNSQDYVVSSHVIEHVPDLIGAFIEWNRLLKSDGIVFIIAPKRNALITDIGRELSRIEDIEKNHIPENKGYVNEDVHIWVFDIELLTNLVLYCNENHGLNWEIVLSLETDDKVGNGHCVICRKK